MGGSAYHELDYTFGQTMLALRMRVGLTQTDLAAILGVSRKAIGDWERGSSYPQPQHLKQFIALAIQRRAFPAGRVVEEVRILWESAHQKILIDETWLATLLPPLEVSRSTQRVKDASPASVLAHRVDWNDAPVVPTFYGRKWEMERLTDWVVAERCRVVSILGLGGVGKSTVAIRLMRLLVKHFEVVVWRSLRTLTTCDELFDGLLQVLAPGVPRGEAASREKREGIIMEQLRKTRALLVLDNLDALLEEGEILGRMRPGFEGMERFLNHIAETKHQSCVLLTSREAPAVLVPLEGGQASVRALRLAPLDSASCDRLLTEKELIGNPPDRMRLIKAYSGNPLALKIAAHTIVDLFDGEIMPFLEKGEVIIGGVRSLLEEQFYRLSSLEHRLLLWLTILREPATFDQLLEVWVAPVSRARLMEALDALYRRSLIERGSKAHEFAPQPLVKEYLMTWLLTHATTDDRQG